MASDFNAAARAWDTPEKIARSARIADAIAEAVPLDPRWNALDYGCGTGQLTWHLARHLRHVTLADTSPGMLDVAREHAALDPERFAVVNHDLAHEPLPEPVDLAYSAMTLHHIPDTTRVLQHLTTSLSPGGWVALADLDADPDNHFHDDDFDGHHGIDRRALADALGGLGYVDVTHRTATRITKEKHGFTRSHDVFLVTGRRPR